jgi:pimeloyl-ACP methyl ester carboxylesterase
VPVLGEDLRCVTYRDAAGGVTSAFVPRGEPGPATPLFCVPALGLDGRSFAALAPFAAQRRVVFWNPPNDLPRADGLDALAACAMEHADRAGLTGRFVLLGSSMGAMIAVAAAAARPERIAGLVLSGGAARWDDLGIPIRLTRLAHPLLPRRSYHRAMPWVLAPGSTSDPIRAALHDQMRHRTKEYGAAAVAALAGAGGFDLTPRLASIAAPTLIVHALRDPVAPWRAAQHLATIPRAQLVAIDAAAHVPYLTHPAEFLPPLAEFLASLDAAEPA